MTKIQKLRSYLESELGGSQKDLLNELITEVEATSFQNGYKDAVIDAKNGGDFNTNF